MYILRQTTQSPLQFNWCGNGLRQSYEVTPSGTDLLWNQSGLTSVYISPNGTANSVYTNNRGTLSYTFTKAGATTGTTTGTANSSTFFTDSKTGSISGTTNYTLTITDGNTGQQYTYNNSIVWGAI